jgi:nicotinate-nucleotide adenylyltransferase
MIKITEKMLDALREQIKGSMSPKRFVHTAAVEEMVARLCALYCPEYTMQLRAAALLHDLTKELTPEEQEALCEEYGIPVDEGQRLSPKTYHAKTAAARIAREFAAFADPIIIDAVRWHTTGHAGMTLTEKLLYLADYIDESRTFPTCVLLRRYFFGAEPELMTEEKRERHLRATLLLSYEHTLKDLLAEGAPIDADTTLARNELLVEAARDIK